MVCLVYLVIWFVGLFLFFQFTVLRFGVGLGVVICLKAIKTNTTI